MNRPIIALSTDYGAGSPYVAQLKGVLLSIAPEAHLVDVTHELPPFDVRAAEVVLRGVYFAFPLGTVHLVVVDPGVGTSRRPLAVQARGTTFVGPDNGILGRALQEAGATAVVLDRPELFRQPVAPTFHGRDVFAPVAAELAQGLTIADVGSRISDALPSLIPSPRREGLALVGESLGADRFGNLTTNIPWADAEPLARVTVGGRSTRRVRTYADAQAGELAHLAGSDGYLELAVREGSALQLLGTARAAVRCE